MRPIYTAKRLQDAARAIALERSLQQHERWTRERLEQHQQASLERLVTHAREKSPFYGRALSGIAERGVRLEELPTLDKRTMMDNWDDIVTDRRLRIAQAEYYIEHTKRDDHHLGEYRICATAGSTGRKGVFAWNRREWSTALATVLRYSAFIGARPAVRSRTRVASIAASSPIHTTSLMSAALDVGMTKLKRLDATVPIGDLVKALNDFQPEVINAYPSIASLLALEQIAGRLEISPRAVCTLGEVRTQEMTSRIRDAWGTDPFNCYGMTEIGVFGCDDEHHAGIHPFEDLVIVEIVDEDGRAVEPGITGYKVLITSLYNFTQPLIRYEVSDLLTIAPDPCPCGRPFRLIEDVEGRSDDLLELPGERGRPVTVHPLHLRSPMATLSGIRQYQFVQEADGLHLLVVLLPDANGADAVDVVRRAVADKLAVVGVDPAILVVHSVDEIPRAATHANKFKLVRSNV